VLELLRELKMERGLALMLITHDMGVAAMVADRIVVMYAGRVVESGPVGTIFREPRHPYTKGLIDSARDEGGRGRSHASIPGAPPDLRQLPAGCTFAPRCSLVRTGCHETRPELRQLGESRAACILEDQERPWLWHTEVVSA
jgi:oligopeptide/dipeptide ABC transporter ATP-binding protein